MGSKISTLRNFQIIFDRTSNDWHAGDCVTGSLIVHRSDHVSHSNFDVDVWGEAVYTSEQSSILDCDGQVYHTFLFFKRKHTISIDGKHPNDELASSTDDGDLVSIPFELSLPGGIPPSFGDTSYPAVRYWLEIHGSLKDGRTISYYRQSLNIQGLRIMDSLPGSLTAAQDNGQADDQSTCPAANGQQKLTTVQCGNKCCTLQVLLHSARIEPGEQIVLQCTVSCNEQHQQAAKVPVRGQVTLIRLIGVANQEQCTVLDNLDWDIALSMDDTSVLREVLLHSDAEQTPSSFMAPIGIDHRVINVFVRYVVRVCIYLPEHDLKNEWLATELDLVVGG